MFHSAEPGRVHVNRGGIWVLVKKVASAHPGAGRSDVDGHRRQREGQPGCGSRSLGRSSSHVATRHSSTPSALLRPGRRSRTHPSPAAQVPPPPPSSPFSPPLADPQEMTTQELRRGAGHSGSRESERRPVSREGAPWVGLYPRLSGWR